MPAAMLLSVSFRARPTARPAAPTTVRTEAVLMPSSSRMMSTVKDSISKVMRRWMMLTIDTSIEYFFATLLNAL